jgi:glycopeptide antibiotics resistance protein
MMPNYRNLSLKFLLAAFLVLLAVMLAVTLYPFNFFSANGVQWLSDERGLYFNGQGIAYTDKAKTVCETETVSVVLWLKERFGSKNWGPKEIFSFNDGIASPPLVVGHWSSRIFLYSRFEKNKGDKWYELFRTKHRLPRGKSHLVTATFGGGVKAIYIDGELSNKSKTEIRDTIRAKFCGSLMIGNSPKIQNGWRGEIKGLAIYNRVLLPEEILKHSREVFQNGMLGLAETSGCIALYTFDEGKGTKAESIVGKSRILSIPTSLIPPVRTILFNLPYYKDTRGEAWFVTDFLSNILLFVPYGVLFTTIILRKYTISFFLAFIIVTFAGCLLSFTIESLQLFLPTRSSVINDIYANMIGSGVGVLIAYALKLHR